MTVSHEAAHPLPSEVDVAIIGAGIGGLAAAIALSYAGVEAHVFERTAVLREIGGAVLIRDPVVQLLREWGLERGFRDQAVLVDGIERHDQSGALIEVRSADFAGDGDAYSVHRADVHNLLRSAIPSERIHLGAATTQVLNDGESAIARFDDGAGVRARLVIGADGIRSVVRRAVVDDEVVFAKLVVLRGISPASAVPKGLRHDRMIMWVNDDIMMITLPLGGGTQVALDTAIAQDEAPDELWSTEVPMKTLLEHFKGFDQGLLDLISAGTTPVLAHPVYEREPISTWSSGRITLLGDAAHPMAPRQGQGANQAILDAAALAAALTETGLDRVDEALRRYEDVRVGPATTMQIASRTAPALPSGGRR